MPLNYQEPDPVPLQTASSAKMCFKPTAYPPQPAKGPQQNAWTGSNPTVKNANTASNATRNAYTQHSTVASRVPAQVRSGKSNFGAAGPSVSNLNAKMAQANVSNPYNNHAAPYNPSQGPTASQITTPWRTATTNGSKASFPSARRGINTAVCKLSGYTKKDFQKGEVISLPFHCANTNPHVDPNTDNRWRSTVEGPVYSKRRMMVILFIYEQDMLCLPLYTWNKGGITRRPACLKKEYVGLKDANNNEYVNYGDYNPVVIEGNRRPMHEHSTVVLSAGCKVGCNEDILSVGRLTERSHDYLVELWQKLNLKAEAEAWNR